MATPVDLGFINYFLPILAFMLVFIVIYAILQKSSILGDNQFVSLFISIIMASFFIVQVQLVDFVAFTSSWMGVIIMLMFMLFLALAFIPMEKPFEFLAKNNWFNWVVMGLMIVFFIISSSYVFNWAVNWDYLLNKTDSQWFGFLLLVLIGGAVSFILTKK